MGLEEDIEPWVVQACMGTAAGLAVLFALLAALMPGAPSEDVATVAPGVAKLRVGALAERGQLLRLVERQRAQWAGDQPAAWAASSETLGTEMPAAASTAGGATRRSGSANKV